MLNVPKDLADRGDRLESLLVDIKRLLEVIAARQLVQIEIAEPHDEEAAKTAATLSKMGIA